MDLGNKAVEPIRILGAGSFGRVFLCKYRNTNKLVCIKRIEVTNPKKDIKRIMSEVYILSHLRHPNIIQFIYAYIHAGTVNIVMEYAPNGTLFGVIQQTRPKGLNYSDIMHYFLDILMGIEYLHIRKVFHRDLKPANLLININNRIKIADFGISYVQSTNTAGYESVGTLIYSAPEILRGEKYEYKSDIWSLGCILYEMCTLRYVFPTPKTSYDLLLSIEKLTNPKLNCIYIRTKYGDLLADLCERMVMPNIIRRISLPDIVCIDPNLTIAYYKKYFDYKY